MKAGWRRTGNHIIFRMTGKTGNVYFREKRTRTLVAWRLEVFKQCMFPCRGKMKTEIQNQVMHSDV